MLRQKPPRCTDIVELPFSMSAMDHLVGVANRTLLKGGEGAGERGLMQVMCVYVCVGVYVCGVYVCLCVWCSVWVCMCGVMCGMVCGV